jgi:hypothetical protein
MPLTLGKAAKAAGVSRTAIQHSIASGRLSATKDDLGRWQIDPAELHRVYKPVADNIAAQVAPVEHPVAPGESAELRELRARLADAQETIADLRCRLDEEAAERRQAQARLTALLTDQRSPTTDAALEPASLPRRRWWHFGKVVHRPAG